MLDGPRFSREGAEMIENWVVGAVAFALVVYLIVALLRPDKF
jgi:K+-transporting ATPase KdpF subunit